MKRSVGRIAVVAAILIVAGFTASQTFLAGSSTPQPLGAQGLVASNFKDGALSQPIAEEACMLSDPAAAWWAPATPAPSSPPLSRSA